MTWFAQVRHIASKDLRESRWVLSVCLATAVAATIRAIAAPFAPDFAGTALMLLVVMTGIVAAAILVQADSPTWSKAFWATRPFSRSAVVWSKMLLAFASLAVVPLVGESIALRQFDLSGPEFWSLIANCAFSYGMWLLAAMVVAALTADLRTFILTFMAIAVVVVIAPTLTSRPILGATAFARGLVGIVTAALGIWLLIHVYKTRLATPLTWLVATTVLMGALRFVFSGAPSQVVPAESSANGRLQLRIAIGDSGRVTQGRVNLRIAVEGAPSNEAVLVMVDGAVLRLRDGRSVRPKSTGGVSPFRVPDLPVGPSIRWLGSHEYRFAVNSMSLYLDPRDAHDVAEGLVAVELAAQVITLLPRVVGELPLRPGESLTLDGKKTRIDFVDHVGNVATVQIRTAEVASRRTAAESFVFGPQLPAQALVNANRREAMLLYSGSSGGGPEWLVLPGVSLFANEYSLTNELGARAAGNVPLDDAWYVDARLAIVRWVPTLNYPVRARATLR